jgi:hypothetical protein
VTLPLDTLPTLSPYALVTYEQAERYLRRHMAGETDAEYWIRSAINWVTGEFERETGRDLIVRTYRTAVTQTCTLTSGSESITVASGAALKEFDDVSGTGIADGSRIYGISGNTVTLTRQATAGGSQSITFGSAPVSVTATRQPYAGSSFQAFAGKFPIQSVYSVGFVDNAGVLTAFDLTGMRIDKGTGKIILPNGYYPCGDLDVQIELMAGIMPSKAGTSRGFDGWSELSRGALRAIEVLYQDYRDMVGRGGTTGAGGFSRTVSSFEWPADVQSVIRKFTESW